MNKILSLFRKITPFQIITSGFLLVILLGSLLLYLPLSRAGDSPCSYLDALFTSTSAVCVTGLVVHNTGTYWSTFGHGVLAVLIQIGGLGVITVAITFSLLSGKKIGLRTRDLMQNAIGAPQLGGIIRFTRFLLLFTLLAESAGAFLLAPGFIRRYGVGNGIAKSFFHSISAFCNAGFDTLDKNGTFASLTRYSADLVVNLVIMLLIIIGGLGFFTWKDLIRNRFRWKNLKMQTRLILTTTALLILVPAIVFFFFQFTQGSLKERILMSLFQSVTTRTAGFNTADIGSLKEGSRLIMILLMLVGGSPGSTAGGIKTTTGAVLLLVLIRNIRRNRNIRVFGRTIPEESIQEAYTVFFLYLILFLTGSLVLSALEEFSMLDCMFECASALGTVGLSTGITASLGAVSKLILIFFMYFGRVGGLTLAYAALQTTRPNSGKLPEAHVMIG
jgi:trk system potassium uptake protein TrkH